jgi:multidrug efflux pump subunit AcrB
VRTRSPAPALAATLTICIVFFPVVLLTGPARYLFTPLAVAVVFSMLASYVLSRTLVPALARLLEAEHAHAEAEGTGLFARFNRWRDDRYGRFQEGYGRMLGVALHHRPWMLATFSAVVLITVALPVFAVGLDFFPDVDVGLMRLHFRAPVGTRITDTERLVLEAERKIREIIPPDELEGLNDNIGIPLSYNLAFVSTDNIGPQDAEILISLKPGHKPTRGYMKRIRDELPPSFPGSSRVLPARGHRDPGAQLRPPRADRRRHRVERPREGLHGGQAARRPAPADPRRGRRADPPGARLPHAQPGRGPAARRAGRAFPARRGQQPPHLPVQQLAGGAELLAEPPEQRELHRRGADAAPGDAEHDDLLATPLTSGAQQLRQSPTRTLTDSAASPGSLYLGTFSQLSPGKTIASVNHSTIQRVINVQAAAGLRDLGSVARDIDKAIASLHDVPKGIKISVRGQIESMRTSFGALGLGLILAVVLVYLLMVVLFQSWLDPFIILAAVPGALVGILWILAVTGTTLNVESFMGAIMSVGIAVSNSILLVSYANEVRSQRRLSPVEAALEAGKVRLRPVLMTALAMVLGMLPMALALGEGGEQNAPLGRAVIGGLLVATFVTLFIVPVVYSVLRRKEPQAHQLDERFLEESQGAHPGALA